MGAGLTVDDPTDASTRIGPVVIAVVYRTDHSAWPRPRSNSAQERNGRRTRAPPTQIGSAINEGNVTGSTARAR